MVFQENEDEMEQLSGEALPLLIVIAAAAALVIDGMKK